MIDDFQPGRRGIAGGRLCLAPRQDDRLVAELRDERHGDLVDLVPPNVRAVGQTGRQGHTTRAVAAQHLDLRDQLGHDVVRIGRFHDHRNMREHGGQLGGQPDAGVDDERDALFDQRDRHRRRHHRHDEHPAQKATAGKFLVKDHGSEGAEQQRQQQPPSARQLPHQFNAYAGGNSYEEMQQRQQHSQVGTPNILVPEVKYFSSGYCQLNHKAVNARDGTCACRMLRNC